MANFFSAPAHTLNHPRHYLLLLLIILLLDSGVFVNATPTKLITDQAAVDNDDYGLTWELSDDDNSQLNHKIISKSVNSAMTDEQAKVDVSADSQSTMTSYSSIIRRDKGKDDSKEAPRRGAGSAVELESKEKPSFEDKQKAKRDSVEIEDGILQEIIAMRRDAKHFRIRNSSELHIDNHNVASKEETRNGKSNANASWIDFLPKVLYLQKPFHFHIPIVPGPQKRNSLPQKVDNAGNNHAGVQQGPRKGKIKRTNRRKNHRRHANGQAVDDATVEQFYGNDEQRHLAVRNSDPERLEERTDFPNLHSSAYVNQQRTVGKGNIEAEASQPEPQEHVKIAVEKSDMDQLIDQYPKLMPSMNRKRHSQKHNKGLDLLEDENHYHLVNVNIPRAPASVAEVGSKQVTGGKKKNVKNVIFSQDVVDSILGHEDDFLNYQNKIKNQAKKLGLKPEDIFQAVVNGKLPPNSSTPSNIENHDIHRRRQQFQKLFLEAVEDSLESQNPNDANSPQQKGGNSIYNQKRYNSYMKILKRNKRGLKSWLKSVFKRGNDDTTSTTTTKAPKSKRTRKLTHTKVHVHRAEVNEDGDSEVDLLLPKALRRSTYLKNRDHIKAMLKEEEEFEEEYAKSQEKEEKLRDESRRRKRATKDNEYVPEIRLRKIYTLSKDEMVLINDMILNVVEFRCEKNNVFKPFPIDGLENFRTVTEKVIETSSFPNYIPEERLSVQDLFNQLLACTEWLSNSDRAASNTWKGTTGSNNDTGNDSYVPPYDRPLRRTKRVRREGASSIGFKAAIAPSRPMVKFDGDKAERSFINSIQGFLKLHFRFYKLALGSCQPFVEKELLHDSILHLLNEFFSLPYSPMPRREELYQFFEKYPIDINGAEKNFNDC